ncbi:MAG: (E)-4-hydroxy-3-methylbut-2-enyl-diphosphate synthase [Muribaculaceae bacterium]|nr:(E)-4-hydroxy-3-methylbut-2-enyl-diphosphate synthase [Muribaculaceae bacterium]
MEGFDYSRRRTVEVRAGRVAIGGDNPVRLQSMTNTSTMDADGSVRQSAQLAAAGSELVRLTAQGVREADNIGVISSRLREAGVDVPLVADIHFNPRAAFAAAVTADKVRINPGNFVDPGRVFKKLEYTDEEYAAELQRIDDALTPFLELCRENGTAIRIGVNHGSLSDRIMSRFGDNPAGMTESAMEFLRVCRKRRFDNVVISIKASNVGLMVETVRMLADAMAAEDMHYPIHLGVTEAGDGEDGRVKSAVGIATLLTEGIGDTIRVSLSEDPVNELPVARMLADYSLRGAGAPHIPGTPQGSRPNGRRRSLSHGAIGGDNPPAVAGGHEGYVAEGEMKPDFTADEVAAWPVLVAPLSDEEAEAVAPGQPVVLTTEHPFFRGAIRQAMHQLSVHGKDNPVMIRVSYKGLTPEQTMVYAAADLGPALLDGFADGIQVESDSLSDSESISLAFAILQSTRQRISRTEYISCPSCGRTMFDLQQTLAAVKAATASLKGLKIGVMGCVVNGPGEMADADYGYVGAGVGRVSLYRGKECVRKNIPAEEAVDALTALIKSDGRWT